MKTHSNRRQEFLGAQSTISPKGIITIPNSIRELVGLGVGDKVGFKLNADGSVLIKNNSVRKSDTFMNLMSKIAKRENCIVVNGEPKTGKTELIIKLLMTAFKGKSVSFISELNRSRVAQLAEKVSKFSGETKQITDRWGVMSGFTTLMGLPQFQTTTGLASPREAMKQALDKIDVLVIDENVLKQHEKTAKSIGLYSMLKEFKGVVIVEATNDVEEWWFEKDVLEIELVRPIRSDYDYKVSATMSIWSEEDGDWDREVIHELG